MLDCETELKAQEAEYLFGERRTAGALLDFLATSTHNSQPYLPPSMFSNLICKVNSFSASGK